MLEFTLIGNEITIFDLPMIFFYLKQIIYSNFKWCSNTICRMKGQKGININLLGWLKHNSPEL